MGLFDKKYCDVCGDKIGLLGNRKLDDGNLCKNCSKKLSPWFSERRSSSVAQIKEQLAYREENREALRDFHVSRSLGNDTRKLLIDEAAGKFIISSGRNLEESNPDIVELSQVTGCDLDIDEHKRELKKKDAEGKSISYNPPRYEYSYSFTFTVRVNHPYFDDMRFDLSSGYVDTGTHSCKVGRNDEYDKYVALGEEVKAALMADRTAQQEEQQRQDAPQIRVQCPYCGASAVPNSKGQCEYCGMTIS